jgi:hypothetical protein
MEIREAVDKLTEWVVDVQLSNRVGFPVFNNPGELKEAIKTLLMEFEYREYERKM